MAQRDVTADPAGVRENLGEAGSFSRMSARKGLMIAALTSQTSTMRTGEPFRKKRPMLTAQVKPVSEILQTHGPGKLRPRPNPLLPSLSQTLPTFLYATSREKTAATLHSQKDFRTPAHKPDRPRILRNRRASTCDPASGICDFAPRRAPDIYDGHARDEEAQINKTDRNDARGIAQMMRVGCAATKWREGPEGDLGRAGGSQGGGFS
jgi:hypothetical protein